MKKIFLILIFTFSLLGILWEDNTYKPLKTQAETTEYFEPELYTKSDNLLAYDGTKEDKTITGFATDVKNADNYTPLNDINKVVPRQYLESGLEIGK